jgi:hypothetical protein
MKQYDTHKIVHVIFLEGFFYFFETGSDYVAQAGLEPTILLPLPPCPLKHLFL